MKSILLVLLFTISFQSNAQWTGAVFDTLTHNNVRDEVNHQCIDIDQSNNLHVVYGRANSVSGWDTFYKMRDNNGTWSTEDTIAVQTDYTSVITASNIPGEAFIAYNKIVGSDEQIFVCSNSGSSWNCQQVTFDTLQNINPSIAIDSAGHIHLAWIGFDSHAEYKIKYATDLSGSWVIQELTASQLGQFGSGAGPEIAVDKNGIAFISYRGENINYHIYAAFNLTPGGTAWNYNYVTTPNDEDLSSSIQVDGDTVVHLIVSGDAGFGFPAEAFYQTKHFSDSLFSSPVQIAPAYHASVGDLFVDGNNVVHCVLNEISGNIYTGNVIYANSNNWTGIVLLNTGDIYNANIVVDDNDNAYLACYQGNTFASEEVVVYGASASVGISKIGNENIPFNVYSTDNVLKINFNENFSGRLVCYAIDGRIIFEEKKNFDKSETYVVENMSKGMYLLSVESGNSKFVRKIVVE